MLVQDLLLLILECEYVVLIGYGWVGGLVSVCLCVVGMFFVVVVDKCDKVDELCEQGYSVVFGNVVSFGVLELVNIVEVCWLLIVIFNGFEVGQIVSYVCVVNLLLDIVVWVYFDVEVDYLEQNGVNLVIMGECEIVCGMVYCLGFDCDECGVDVLLLQLV